MRIAVRVAADFHFHFTAKRRFLDGISVITSKSVPLFLHSSVVAVRRDWRSSVAVVHITQILRFLGRPHIKPLSLPRRRRAGTGQKKSMSPCGCSCLCCLVRGKRLELSRLAALEPKSSASTNSAIPALLRRSGEHYTRPPHEAALVQTRTPLPERRARVTSFRVRRYPRNARCRPRRDSCPTAPR